MGIVAPGGRQPAPRTRFRGWSGSGGPSGVAFEWEGAHTRGMSTAPATLWIGGQRVPSASGLEFQLGARDGSEVMRGPWPRCGPEDVRGALAAADGAQDGWRRTPRAERLELLLACLTHLESELDGELSEHLAPALGRPAVELRRLLGEDLFRARESLELLREGGAPTTAGAGLFVAHWGDLCGGLLARLGRRLLEGSSAVLVADPLVPETADLVSRALEAVGGPPGLVNLLVDEGRELVRHGLDRTGLAWIRLRGGRRELERLARMRGPEVFGAGLTEWEAWPLSSRVHLVTEGDDPVAAAELVVRDALEPATTLFGQLPDRIGRVLVHTRQVSAFTQALLERLDGNEALSRPTPLVEPGRFAWLAEAWSLGLDEGAAPIFGEAPADADRREDGSESGPDALISAGEPAERRSREPRRVRPIVFTNVDVEGRLLRLEEPGPLLRLCRVESDERGHALKRALEAGALTDTDQAPRKPRP